MVLVHGVLALQNRLIAGVRSFFKERITTPTE
jgi:hypothetical protein